MERNNPSSDKHPPILSYCLGTSSGQRFSEFDDVSKEEKTVDPLKEQAFKTCHWDDIQKFIENNSENINDINPNGDRLLHLAIQRDKWDVIHHLLEKKDIDINLQNKNEKTPLLLLYELRIEKILNKNFFQSLWYWISPHGRKDRKTMDDLIVIFIEKGGSVNDRDGSVNVKNLEKQIKTLEVLKGWKGWIHNRLIKKVIKEFVFFNLFHKTGNVDSSQIDQSIEKIFDLGSVPIVQHLFDNGIYRNLSERKTFANEVNSSLDEFRFHIKSDWNIDFNFNFNSSFNKDFLEEAVLSENVEMVNYLLSKGMKVTQKSLESAIQGENLDILKQLFAHCGDAKVIQKSLESTIQGENLDILKQFLAHGGDAKVDPRRPVYEKNLHQAIREDNIELVQCFFQKIIHRNKVYTYEKTLDDRLREGETVEVDCDLSENENVSSSHYSSMEQLTSEKQNLELYSKYARIKLRRIRKKNIFDRRDRKKGFLVNSYKGTLFHLALRTGHMQVVKYFVENDAQINRVEKDGKTLYHWANLALDSEHLNYFIDNGADLHLIDTDGNTALHCVCRLNNRDIVKYFVEQQLDLNATNSNKETPLEIASQTGSLDVVRYLVEHGADVTQGYCIHRAIESENLAVLKYLVEHDADLTKTNHNNPYQASIALAMKINNVNIVKYLVEQGLPIAPFLNDTFLTGAILKKSLDMVKYLIETHQMNDTKVNKEGQTPLQVAIQAEAKDIVEYFVEELKVNINQIQSDTTKPYHESYLHFLVKREEHQFLKYFLEQGAKLDIKGSSGFTVLELAQQEGNQEALQILNEFIQQKQAQTST